MSTVLMKPTLTKSMSEDHRLSNPIDPITPPSLITSISTDTKAIPIQKELPPSRFSSFFSTHATARSNIKPHPSSSSTSETSLKSAHSFSSSSLPSSTDDPHKSHKFSKSIGNLISSPASWTRKHLHKHHHHHNGSGHASPSVNVPKLNEKYGDYVKPSKKASTKTSGATNKNNIGSGATAVIRLVQSKDRILAVKEFRKREKTEDEKEYLKRMHNEYCISKSVSGHPNVVETMDLVVDEHDRWCTVMEYVS